MTRGMTKQEYSFRILHKEIEGSVVVLLSSEHMTADTSRICDQIRKNIKTPFSMCELLVKDWDTFLTPWPVDSCLKGRNFQGRGVELLSILKEEILPAIAKEMPNNSGIYLAGYSLAGLFALWAFFEISKEQDASQEPGAFLRGAVCGSGSFWYPKWEEYFAKVSVVNCGEARKIYLSLGKKEPLGKHPLMKEIGNITTKMFKQLSGNDSIQTIFEWTEGGHFSNIPERMMRGITWTVE